jgi:hypothetical protein
MKTHRLAAIALTLLILGTASGQTYFADRESYEKANLDRGEKNFEANLKSSNEGVLESSLALIGRIKLYYPERPMDKIEKEVYQLSVSGPTDKIRYKAYLVHNVFTNPAMFAIESKTEYTDSDQMFTALAIRLQNNYISAN